MTFFTPEFYHSLNWEKFSDYHNLREIADGLWIGKLGVEYQFYIVGTTGLLVCPPNEFEQKVWNMGFSPYYSGRIQEALKAIRRKKLDNYCSSL
jgi:hypothetical protein